MDLEPTEAGFRQKIPIKQNQQHTTSVNNGKTTELSPKKFLLPSRPPRCVWRLLWRDDRHPTSCFAYSRVSLTIHWRAFYGSPAVSGTGATNITFCAYCVNAIMPNSDQRPRNSNDLPRALNLKLALHTNILGG